MRLGISLLAFAALALGVGGAGTPADAQPVEGLPGVAASPPRLISPGVEVFPFAVDTPFLRGRVARIAPDVVRDRLRVVVSNDQVAETTGPRRETTSSMCRRYRCVVGVNADQWYVSGADPSTPIGGTIVDGELWRTPEPDPNPFTQMGQLQFDANGTPDARPAPAGWSTTLEATTDEGPVRLELQLNRIPLDGQVTLYTHRLGARTPLDPGITEWAVTAGPVRAGSTTLTPASGALTGGGTALRDGQAVLATRGELVDVVGGMLSGPVSVLVDVLGARWASGGFPVLMEGGEYTIFPDDPDNSDRRAGRTVAGWTATGELLLVTVDERPGWSAGATVVEAARLLRTLGAVEAINLDGGGSTTFVEGGRVMNRPSDGTDAPVERPVVDAVLIDPPEGIDFGTAAPRFPEIACPVGQIPPPPYDDLGGDTTHRFPIACVAARSIAAGVGPRAYGPTAPVSRAQMATFLERLIVASGAGVPGDVADAFADDETSLHETAINRLAAMQVVGGVGDGRYDPEGRVTRAQMATFLARALWVAQGGALVGAERDYFVDDALDLHEANINIVAEQGIAGGTAAGGVYSPGAHVSRGQMASFLARTLDTAMAS